MSHSAEVREAMMQVVRDHYRALDMDVLQLRCAELETALEEIFHGNINYSEAREIARAALEVDVAR